MLFEKQQYQTDCVANITNVLGECNVFNSDFQNLTNALDALRQQNPKPVFETRTKKKRLDVLMETGTGKTFTYLKTIFELHKQFNKKKFIIVVPRTSIKLGVIQNIKLTRDYFFKIYKRHLNYIDYPRDGLSKIKHDFIKSDDFSVLITTNAAFNSEKNNINKKEETFFEHGSTWKGIANQHPIVIIDEPHLLKGTQTKKGLDKLKDSLFIRFGATYPDDEDHKLANVVYCLDSISSFNEFLVKRIRVNTVINDSEIGALQLIETKARSSKFSVTYHINTVVFTKEISLKQDIGAVTSLNDYNGISAVKITKDTVYLSNHKKLGISKGNYSLSDGEIETMIEKTIAIHFSREEELFQTGAKTLSLFFIPNISDFRESDHNPKPRIKTIFERVYKEMWTQQISKTTNESYKKYLQKDFDEEKLTVHQGYFSGDSLSKTQREAKMNKDDVGIDMILNQKEALLSFDTQLRFIFSVWALQEGWDNPNVFTICKLSATAQDISRRQQVGRGLRIALNQQGKRLTHSFLEKVEKKEFYDINTLDVIVSGQEKEFIHQIQQEIQAASYSVVGDFVSTATLKDKGLNEQEAASLIHLLSENEIIAFDKQTDKYRILFSISDFLQRNKQENLSKLHVKDERYQFIQTLFTNNAKPIIDPKKPTHKVKIRQDKWKDFKTLWEKINTKASIVYKDIEQEALIKAVSDKFNKETILPMQTRILTRQYNTRQDCIETLSETSGEKVNFFHAKPVNDFVSAFVKDAHWPLKFILKLMGELRIDKIKNNPSKAKTLLGDMLQETIHSIIIRQMSYEFSQTSIYPNSLQDEKGQHKKEICSRLLGKFHSSENIADHLLYDTICYDSDIEKRIQQEDPGQINDKTVTVFAKLPRISIPTPYKTYNPDFAYLIERQNKKTLFLIVEAKGYDTESDIPAKEQKKIDYARKFFRQLQEYSPGIDIVYKTRINRQTLSDLLE